MQAVGSIRTMVASVECNGVAVPVRGGRASVSTTCDACHKTNCARLRKCTRCEAARYCSVACQRAAWPAHKHKCAPPRRTRALCARCGRVEEIACTGAIVAVGATKVPCGGCGRVSSGDPKVEAALLRALVRAKPDGPHAPLAHALVGKFAFDAMAVAGPDAYADVRAEALESLTRSADRGVAASAAALGQFHYREAMAAQKVEDARGPPPDGAPAASPAVAAALNLARDWYRRALGEAGPLRLTDAERDQVGSIPYVRAVIGTDRFKT